ncbi:FG-GAP repeat domain-containing protein [Ovoidimarina sediminis]|uniref:FG-GAP repeat domain-containing protein n=1 Tax=Ovoidimarina sediminis TaxID=3079856 RepID=UPI0029102616|nr:VCBS repeat-containing protein [Rhodophyticola sp. MJ-SS7]MDU8942887.1 VCBS repeat-containing protein [Rhodophyticola sp. MJ-SS7]
MWRAAALLAACLAGPALACDYPGPPPNSPEARSATGDIRWAAYSDATGRYAHGILGDAVEAGGLRVEAGDKGACDLYVILPEQSVFEDTGPRIADLDGDGRNEVIVVESHRDTGAALAVYGIRNGALVKLDATPNIGSPNRWLAPVGIADLDGDGATEIAYVDRPHLAKILRVWRWKNGRLREVAAASGVTNHRIGETDIAGGVRECGDGPEMIVADAAWRDVMAVRLLGGTLSARRIGAHEGRRSFAAAMSCR